MAIECESCNYYEVGEESIGIDQNGNDILIWYRKCNNKESNELDTITFAHIFQSKEENCILINP